MLSLFRRRRLPLARGRLVVCHTVDGSSYEGILVGVYADVVTLMHAQLLVPDGPPRSLDGFTHLPLANVSAVQE
jgi:hypothetical protein